MKKLRLLIVLILCLSLCGCGSWLDGQYHNVTPHLQEDAKQSQTQSICRSYTEIRDALIDMVENGTSEGVIYTEGFTQDEMIGHMDSAVGFVTRNNAIGAYAVESIEYELGTNAATPAVAVNIVYTHSRSEILRIKRTDSMAEVERIITSALNNCDAGVTFRIEKYVSTDLAQLVEDYANENPHICMELPQVTVLSYPERGPDRVISITFTYQTSRDSLRNMQVNVQPVFSSAELYVRGDAENSEKYAQLYSFLMERYDYTVETSITPAYSLLRHGVGDSKAFAQVYAQMCEQAGLPCEVVSGTKAGEAWYWNLIQLEDVYLHVDLLECKNVGVFQGKTDEEMAGYVWDYSAFDPENKQEQ